MRRYRIAVIGGDGIGPEVVAAGQRVLEAAAARDGFVLETESFPWGSDYYRRHGAMMPANGLDVLRGFDAIYFGAVGDPGLPDDVTLWGLRLAICQGFDQFVNLRPAKLLPGLDGPLRAELGARIDWIVVRENSEGEYAGVGGRTHRGYPEEIAIESSVFTRAGVARIQRFAFELARTRPEKRLTCVTKSNAQRHGMVLWDEVFAELAAEHGDIETDKVLVDAAAARMVLAPETMDVIVASNLHADILSDLAAALTGSLGIAASANLDPTGAAPSMFEPIHGSAPDISGEGIANPIAAIWTASMMLDHLGEHDSARRLMTAIARVCAEGAVLTPDLGGDADTDQVADAIIAAVEGDNAP
ncbi:MAG: tartrate dehydrogenase [Alphaproteobacteria bacterium]|jgi:tartrate dehydrogenase/decarboxylase/D-malate dehydrogenase|nr:tartrate dehydrogenase [Alphaproteobacteria bacterium]MDP6515823.1 tartrate dehydrogenase [Alphaproteobacteria bacterium]